MQNREIALFIFLRDITLDGGGERIVVNMANEFAQRYDNVNIVSRYSTNEEIHYPLDNRVRVEYIEKRGTKYTVAPQIDIVEDLIYDLKFQWKNTKPLKRIIKNSTPKGHTPIVLFVGYETALSKPRGAYYIGVDGSSSIITKPINLKHRLFNIVKRFSQRKLDIAGVLSDQELENWAELKKPIRILTNFITDIPSNILPDSQRDKTIIAAGRMADTQKGFDRLIETYATIAAKYPDWRLKIFGQGELKSELELLIDTLQMGDYITLEPFSTNIYAQYGKASIFAMSSRFEGFGLVTAEAMACGAVPVALSARRPSGTSFILKDMPECLSPENDMQAFVANLERFMQDPSLRQQTANKARQVVLERFSAEVLMEVWIDLLDELTSKKQR